MACNIIVKRREGEPVEEFKVRLHAALSEFPEIVGECKEENVDFLQIEEEESAEARTITLKVRELFPVDKDPGEG